MMLWIAPACAAVALAAPAAPHRSIDPEIVETRTINVTQTVTLKDIPATSKNVRLWVPVPSDSTWQRVLDLKVVSAPSPWRIERQAEGRGDFVYVELANPKQTEAQVVVQAVVETRGVHFPLESTTAVGSLQNELFADSLDADAPLMQVDARVRKLADEACGTETDPARQAMLLLQKVAEVADHYSKDPTKPVCGRGAAEDCLDQGGGCCTDLHALFIALARAREIPARMQYGYRTLDAKAGPDAYDPGYRCWVEYFIPGAGWVPTDVVASDNADAANPRRWASLSATRVWLWSGRSFELTPKGNAGPTHTMLCGWAEIDGKAVDVLPGDDGSPSKLTRKVQFDIISNTRPKDMIKLPE